MTEFKDALKSARKCKGLTQEQLGKKIGVSSQVVSNLERGYTTSLSPEMLNDIAKALDTTPEVFLGMQSVDKDVSIDYLLGNDTQNCHDQKNNPIDNGNNSLEENYFFFFFDEESLLRDIFSNRIKSAIADMGLSEDDFINLVPIEAEKAVSFLECKGEPTADDLIELSQFLDTSIDYLLGQIPKLNKEEKKLLNSFVKLDTDRKDIIIGKTKELLLQQESSSVAADEKYIDSQGKSLPSSGTGGGTIAV